MVNRILVSEILELYHWILGGLGSLLGTNAVFTTLPVTWEAIPFTKLFVLQASVVFRLKSRALCLLGKPFTPELCLHQ